MDKGTVGSFVLILILVIFLIFAVFIIRTGKLRNFIRNVRHVPQTSTTIVSPSPTDFKTTLKADCKNSENLGLHSFIRADAPTQTKKYLLDSVKRSCKNLVRFDFAMTGIEPSQGSFNFSNIDEMVAMAGERDLTIVGTLGYVPAWATINKAPDGAVAQEKIDQFAEYVKKTVSRYPQIRYWEVFNEPDLGGYRDSPQSYAKILKVSFEAIKKANPAAQVLIGGVSDQVFTSGWLEKLLKDGQNPPKNYYDYANIHIRGPINQTANNTKIARDLFNSFGKKDAPLWITEHGYPAEINFQNDPDFKYGQTAQADYYKKSIPLLLNLGVDKIFVTLRDQASDESKVCRALSLGLPIKSPSGAFCSEGLVTFELKASSSGKDRQSMVVFQSM